MSFSRELARGAAGGVALAVALAGAEAGAATDASVTGQPRPWQMGLQEAVSPVMERLQGFHSMVLVIIVAIAIFVTVLLAYVMVRFNARRNPVPSKTSHNTVLEVLWTVIPVMILVVIAVPSFKLLYYQDRAVDAEMTIKAIGHQWYWTYEYPDNGNFEFDAVMVEEADLGPGQPRLLATDNLVVVPVDTKIRLLVTASDVIHSWAVPAFGVKTDAVPGRVNETWFEAKREGLFYGQCSELCGINHGFMPIAVKVVSKAEFAAWAAEAKTKFARSGDDDIELAAAAGATAD